MPTPAVKLVMDHWRITDDLEEAGINVKGSPGRKYAFFFSKSKDWVFQQDKSSMTQNQVHQGVDGGTQDQDLQTWTSLRTSGMWSREGWRVTRHQTKLSWINLRAASTLEDWWTSGLYHQTKWFLNCMFLRDLWINSGCIPSSLASSLSCSRYVFCVGERIWCLLTCLVSGACC